MVPLAVARRLHNRFEPLAVFGEACFTEDGPRGGGEGETCFVPAAPAGVAKTTIQLVPKSVGLGGGVGGTCSTGPATDGVALTLPSSSSTASPTAISATTINNPGKTIDKIVPGEYKFRGRLGINLLTGLRRVTWPEQRRKHVTGVSGDVPRGACLGVTYNGKKAYVHGMTKSNAAIIGAVAKIIKENLGDGFYWSSLQINQDTVSSPHRDENNEGLSALILAGSFLRGEFVVESCGIRSNRTSVLHVFDGATLHSSEPFDGHRYSVVAFQHRHAVQVRNSEWTMLRSLGLTYRNGCRVPVERALPTPTSPRR